MRPVAPALSGLVLVVMLSGCVPPAPTESPSSAPVGPVAPAAGPLGLADLAAIVGDDDVPATTLLTRDGTPSTAADDLASERDYWVAVGGRPEQCADVVSAAYIVSSKDIGDRLDDPTMLVATVTELDEERFGLMQVYARQFDDAGSATVYLDEFAATVAACPGYQLVDGDTVTWNAVALSIEPLADAPERIGTLQLTETLRRSSALEALTVLLQRDAIVISVYAEITATSTITTRDAEVLAGAIARRLDLL